ncbi:MAG: sigma-70 family RNA polymerase sigma factor [Pseudomonadales bacterium]
MNARLNALAYGMLGTLEDAEEVVQEARLRLHTSNPKPDNEEAYLYRLVSNLCIDRLRQLKVQRRAYFGPWLPEPVADDHVATVDLAQQLSIGFLHLLEELSPAERVSYVLREAFDYSHEEIAELLDISAAAARQRNSRAHRKLAGKVPPAELSDQACKDMLEEMVSCIARDDVDGLVNLLADDVISYADGGGVVSAAIGPVTGRERIATVILHLARKAIAEAGSQFSYERINGAWALVVRQGEQIHSVNLIAGEGGLINRIYTVRNPHKLTRLKAP